MLSARAAIPWILAGSACFAPGADADPAQDIAALEYQRASAPAFQGYVHLDDADLRARAALALARVTPPGADSLLVPLLADPATQVRQTAAFALGQLADSTTVIPLVKAASDSVVSDLALEALGKLGGTSAATSLGDFLNDRRALARSRAALGLARMADTTQAARVVERLQVETIPSVLWPLARALEAAAATPERVAAVLPLLEHGSPMVRAQAARVLGRLEHPLASRPLENRLDDHSWRVRVQAAQALGRLRDTHAAPAVVRTLGDAHALVREAAASALGALAQAPEPPAVAEAALLEAAADPSVSVRRAVAAAFSQLEASKAATAALHALLQDPSPQVAAAALASLAARDSTFAAGALTSYTHPSVAAPMRAAATVALGAEGGPEGLLRLIDLLEDEDWVVATLAADALGALGDTAAEGSLLAAYRANGTFERFDVRLAAVGSLARLGGPRSRRLLAEATLDRDPRLQTAARAALDSLATRHGPWAAQDSVLAGKTPAAGGPRLGQPPTGFPLARPPAAKRARLITARGTIEIELLPEAAPHTVASFVRLTERGFYDNGAFHRVVPDFVVQGGCPRGDGWGGPEYALRSEWNTERYDVGTVGMAHAGKDTPGSQFFITHSPQPHLDGRYTVFGRVVSGMGVVDAIEAGDAFTVVIVERGER